MEISKLKAGETFWSVERTRMGNTMVKTTSVYKVEILSVDESGKFFTYRWNGRRESNGYRVPANWKRKKPMLVPTYFGGYRLATREEQRKAKEEIAQ